MKRGAVVTGAGSGVGQATTLSLLREGWKVAALGRTRKTLEETRQLAAAMADNLSIHECDISDAEAVRQMSIEVLKSLGNVDLLVNAAGTNAPKRSLAELSLEDYHAMINTNLNGSYYCIQAFLPQMRARGQGTIVNIVSEAGKHASPKAGPAYVASKFGQAGLTQSINAEEKAHGIRACAIFPGDIDTPLLSKRPVVPDAAARQHMLKAEDLAQCVLLCVNLPPRAVIEEMIVRPR
jgi:NADP-dependent 3-hydroxy acid dehydrogenase YdfG